MITRRCHMTMSYAFLIISGTPFRKSIPHGWDYFPYNKAKVISHTSEKGCFDNLIHEKRQNIIKPWHKKITKCLIGAWGSDSFIFHLLGNKLHHIGWDIISPTSVWCDAAWSQLVASGLHTDHSFGFLSY